MINKADYALGASAASSPVWLRFLEDYIAGYVLIAGAILVTVRVAIALRDWRRAR